MEEILKHKFWSENPKILITGSSGLVGSAIKKIVSQNNLTENFYFTNSTECDLTFLHKIIFNKGNMMLLIYYYYI